MIPDPSTAENPFVEGGSAGPARDGSLGPSSRAGHHCVCGQLIEAALWDMTLFASESAVAYLPCLFAASQ